MDARAASFSDDNPSHILFWTREQQLYGYANMDRLFPTRLILASDNPYPLPSESNRVDLLQTTYVIDDETHTVSGYMERFGTTGLIVVKDGKRLLEAYTLGHNENARWMSFSVGKSVTSLLIGAALQDGYIKSVDEPITDYLPRLKGGPYDGVSIANVLNMASGVAWDEDYTNPTSDVSIAGGLAGLPLLGHLAKLPQAAVPGTTFNYSTGETHLVGMLLRAAIGNNAATYLQHKIWQPFGMEAQAYWMLDAAGGGELGGTGINATLRDFARIGLFVLADGVLPDGTRVLPEGWMQASTKPSVGSANYGYLWWLRDDQSYQGLGIFGQLLFIDPAQQLVIAHQGAWQNAVDPLPSDHRTAVIEALRAALSD